MNRIDSSEERFMLQALDLARAAARLGETPVGAVVVLGGSALGTGFNQVERLHDPTAHAEVIALREATERVNDWRLPGATLYVTLEPCMMCAAALIHARVRKVVFGTWDHRWGGLGSVFDLSHDPRLNHELEVISGVMEHEAAELLKRFYRTVRGRKQKG